MKKILLLSVCCFTYLFSSAQLNERQLSQLEKEINLQPQPIESKKSGLVNDWYLWSRDWSHYAGGFRHNRSFFALYPDTFVKNVFLDENNNSADVTYNSWVSAGIGFDPDSKAWEDKDLQALKQYTGYFLDSLSIGYGYFRTNKDTSIVDTLIIQVFKSQGSQILKGKYSSDKGLFAVPKIDRKTGRGANPSYEIKVPLTGKDSQEVSSDQSFRIKNLEISLNQSGNQLWLPSDKQAHVTVSFKPGQSYASGDTVYYDPSLVDFGGKMPKKKLNRFGIIATAQTPNVSPLKSYNNGSFIAKYNRYVDTTHDTSFAKGYYNPERFGAGRTSFAYYPQIAFKVSAALSINGDRPADKLSINVYPNPSSSAVLLQYATTKDVLASFTVRDLTGRAMMSESLGIQKAGSHQKQINVGVLTPGMYMLHFTSGNETITRRIVKQ